MDSTMMKFLSLMTAASAAETESKDKMKGKIPKYPATAEPLDEGSSTAWMTWVADFKTYANINNLAPLLGAEAWKANKSNYLDGCTVFV